MPEASIPSPVYWETTNIPTPIQRAWHSEGNAVKVGDYKPDGKLTDENGNEILDDENKPIKTFLYFTHLVPGDIVWYEGHIMMVSSITEPDGYDTDGKPYWNDGSGVKVLESVYSKKDTVFGVTNARNASEFVKVLEDGSQKTREWEIWRQK